MRRSIPLGRRLRAWRGKILLAVAWCGAVLFCIIANFIQPPGPGSVAVASAVEHPVRAPESARIATIQVQQGQPVNAGDVIALLEAPGLSAEIAAADADILVAQGDAGVEGATLGRRFANDVEGARVALSGAQVALERERAELAAAQADVNRAGSPGVGLSQQQVADIQARRDALAASVRAREGEVAALQATYSSARSRNAAVVATPTEARILALTARRDALQARADGLVLRAMLPGVVVGPVPAPGEWVQAGVPVITITETSTREAVVYVDAARAATLTPGQAIHVLPASGGVGDAVVKSIGPGMERLPLRNAQDPTIPQYGVPVWLNVSSPKLMPGEPLGVEF